MRMKAVVVRSFEDGTGARCVDVLRDGAGHVWVECRRDPEDSHGWRRMGDVSVAYGSELEAMAAARAAVGWMEAE
jgi:hypothetical protein